MRIIWALRLRSWVATRTSEGLCSALRWESEIDVVFWHFWRVYCVVGMFRVLISVDCKLHWCLGWEIGNLGGIQLPFLRIWWAPLVEWPWQQGISLHAFPKKVDWAYCVANAQCLSLICFDGVYWTTLVDKRIKRHLPFQLIKKEGPSDISSGTVTNVAATGWAPHWKEPRGFSPLCHSVRLLGRSKNWSEDWTDMSEGCMVLIHNFMEGCNIDSIVRSLDFGVQLPGAALNACEIRDLVLLSFMCHQWGT